MNTRPSGARRSTGPRPSLAPSTDASGASEHELTCRPAQNGRNARTVGTRRWFGSLLGLAVAGLCAVGGAHAQPLRPSAPPGAPAATPVVPAPDPQLEAATRAADAEFSRWKQEQAKLAAEREQVERQRLDPLVTEALTDVDIDNLNRLLEQVRSATSLGAASKTSYLARLQARRVVLLSATASNALSAGALDTARTQISEAATALTEVGPGASSAGPLTQVQARYIAVMAGRSQQLAQGGELAEAQEHLELGQGMLSIIAIDNGPAANAAAQHLAEAKKQLQLAHVQTTIEKANVAERERNLRLALYLYEEAHRKGGQTQLAIDRITDQRRSPALEGGASLFVPGLGQLLAGRPVSALFYFVGTAGLATAGTLLTMSADNKYEQYRKATSARSADSRYSGVKSRWAVARGAFAGALLLHLWNIYDAYSDAQQFNRDNFQ